MLVGVMSDIHGNIKALEKAIEKLEEISVDTIAVCGDIVGYGKHPNECCDLLRCSDYIIVAGNHDWSATKYKLEDEEEEYEEIDLTDVNYMWLRELPTYERLNNMEFTHAELADPTKWTYLHSCAYDYRNEQFEYMGGDVCFIGHSHYKELFVEDKRGGRVYHTVVKGNGDMFQTLQRKRAIVAAGSVGICCNKTKRRNVVTYDTQKRHVNYLPI